MSTQVPLDQTASGVQALLQVMVVGWANDVQRTRFGGSEMRGRLNEIDVSSRGRSRGLTQFAADARRRTGKLLNEKKMEGRYWNSPACAIISSRSLVTR